MFKKYISTALSRIYYIWEKLTFWGFLTNYNSNKLIVIIVQTIENGIKVFNQKRIDLIFKIKSLIFKEKKGFTIMIICQNN